MHQTTQVVCVYIILHLVNRSQILLNFETSRIALLYEYYVILYSTYYIAISEALQQQMKAMIINSLGACV